MIRVLLDELGDGHQDIILKIDVTPSFGQFGDLFYMSDFLGLNDENMERIPQDIASAYINYIQERFDNLDNREQFIVFGIYDEYISGLLVSKGKKGLIKTNDAYTTDIHGHEITKLGLEEIIDKRSPKFIKKQEWLISYDGINKGLDWSRKKIKNDSYIN